MQQTKINLEKPNNKHTRSYFKAFKKGLLKFIENYDGEVPIKTVLKKKGFKREDIESLKQLGII